MEREDTRKREDGERGLDRCEGKEDAVMKRGDGETIIGEIKDTDKDNERGKEGRRGMCGS